MRSEGVAWWPSAASWSCTAKSKPRGVLQGSVAHALDTAMDCLGIDMTALLGCRDNQNRQTWTKHKDGSNGSIGTEVWNTDIFAKKIGSGIGLHNRLPLE